MIDMIVLLAALSFRLPPYSFFPFPDASLWKVALSVSANILPSFLFCSSNILRTTVVLLNIYRVLNFLPILKWAQSVDRFLSVFFSLQNEASSEIIVICLVDNALYNPHYDVFKIRIIYTANNI